MNYSPHMNILLMAAGNLRRYRARSLSLILPLTLVMTVASFMMFTRGGFVREAGIAAAFLPDITVQGVEAGRVGSVSLNLLEKIRAIPHVTKVVPRIWGYLPLVRNEVSESYTLMGLELAENLSDPKLPWAIEAGSFLLPGDRGKVVLGSGVARNLDVSINDRLRIEDTLGNNGMFTVVGIFNTAVQVYSTDLIVTSLEDARSFFGYRQDEASDLLVTVDDPGRADEVAWTILKQFRNVRVLTGKALTDLVKEAFSRRAGTFQALWLVLLVTILLLVWAKSSHINVEGGKEIGILKALGFRTGQIIEMKMAESFLVGLTGTSLGILLGFIYALLGTPGISGYCFGCASIYPKYPVPLYCDPSSLFLLLLLGVVPLTAVSALPAWLAGITEPDAAMRGKG